MELPDIRPHLRKLRARLTVSKRTKLLSKFVLFGLGMTIGAAGVIAGFPILLLMVLGTQSITGIVVSSLAISFGLALVLTGYFWFTF